ncbi:unnamed protein product [Mytilus edulis]|uniref:Chitin-binding type-2 domain-containing protein n=1 Tax=Mytilus edulis TaxID=6550 RepID=A0A8S3PRA8_MYTED|nr:unnamed protein product [Mytilus edulis]
MNTLTIIAFTVIIIPVCSTNICDGSKKVHWKMDPSDCGVFYLCFGTLQHKYKCEKDQVYEKETKTCVEKGSDHDKCSKKSDLPINASPAAICEKSNSVFLTYEESCSKYIDCTTQSVEECPYPLLFDENISRCVQPEKANCGSRILYKDPCDYDENQCRSAQGCVPCYVRYPSCKGLPNGLNPWTGREGSPYFAVCKNERVVYNDMCDFENKKEIFNPEKLFCESMYK